MAKKRGRKPESPPNGHPAETQRTIMFGLRSDLPTVLFDNMQFTIRGDVPLVVLSFFQIVPQMQGERSEVFRAATTTEHAKKMINLMCKQLGYYPERPGEAAQA